jgi:predicted enzyme related to lactoylglutathione lyase
MVHSSRYRNRRPTEERLPVPAPHRINVVFLFVADLERERRFYEAVVGFGPPAIDAGDWVEYRLTGGANFALHRTTPEALAGCDRSRNTLQFSLLVQDIQETFETLTAKGVEFRRPPEHGHGFILAEFIDPEGNSVRLVQYLAGHPNA